jgi:acetyl esterase/lipase
VTPLTDIAYAPEHARYGLLDIVLPDEVSGAPVVVVYHGGGLQALRKERMTHVAEFLAQAGCAVVNANYRLLPEAPFPAPLEDALRVMDWVQTRQSEHLAPADASRLAVLGGSAGGYLALMVGLLHGRERVAGIVSIAGPSTRVRGKPSTEDHDPRLFVPPVELVSASAPTLLCLHSRNDELVLPSESRAIAREVRAHGGTALVYEFDGPGKQHGIWMDERDPPHLFPHLEARIQSFLGDLGLL